MSRRRCICGRSSTLPLCDGAHTVEGWRCAMTHSVPYNTVFAGGPAYHTVVERLAHAKRGSALHHLKGRIAAESLTLITDGTDFDELRPALARVRAEATRILLIGADPALLGGALPGAAVVPIEDSDQPGVLWQYLTSALEQTAILVTGSARMFMSHATDDEPALQPAVEALRRLGVTVFSCGDSIPGGTRWWDEIIDSLHRCERFVLVLTPASRASTWCAFEAGAAVALQKPIQLVSLDGLPPPSFLAHLQMQNVPRLRMLHPWLDERDAVLEAFLAPLPKNRKHLPRV